MLWKKPKEVAAASAALADSKGGFVMEVLCFALGVMCGIFGLLIWAIVRNNNKE